MNEKRTPVEALALEVVNLRRAHKIACEDTADARRKQTRCENAESAARHAYEEAKKKFDAAMDKGEV